MVATFFRRLFSSKEREGSSSLHGLEHRAKRGDAEAQFHLGEAYSSGFGVAKDKAKGANWYRKAADQGYAQAQLRLAEAYDSFALGVEHDEAEAVKWFHAAAEQGNVTAQVRLAWKYSHGDGVRKDLAESIKWYRKAAEMGSANAMLNLGFACRNGTGVPQDFTKAVQWWRRVLQQEDAAILLKRFKEKTNDHDRQHLVIRTELESRLNAQRSAQCALGHAYRKGQGVPRNNTEAITNLATI